MSQQECISLIIIAFIFFFTGFCIGLGEGVKTEREEAIKAGVGRWIIDSKTGDRHFKYEYPACGIKHELSDEAPCR